MIPYKIFTTPKATITALLLIFVVMCATIASDDTKNGQVVFLPDNSIDIDFNVTEPDQEKDTEYAHVKAALLGETSFSMNLKTIEEEPLELETLDIIFTSNKKEKIYDVFISALSLIKEENKENEIFDEVISKVTFSSETLFSQSTFKMTSSNIPVPISSFMFSVKKDGTLFVISLDLKGIDFSTQPQGQVMLGQVGAFAGQIKEQVNGQLKQNNIDSHIEDIETSSSCKNDRCDIYLGIKINKPENLIDYLKNEALNNMNLKQMEQKDEEEPLTEEDVDVLFSALKELTFKQFEIEASVGGQTVTGRITVEFGMSGVITTINSYLTDKGYANTIPLDFKSDYDLTIKRIGNKYNTTWIMKNKIDPKAILSIVKEKSVKACQQECEEKYMENIVLCKDTCSLGIKALEKAFDVDIPKATARITGEGSGYVIKTEAKAYGFDKFQEAFMTFLYNAAILEGKIPEEMHFFFDDESDKVTMIKNFIFDMKKDGDNVKGRLKGAVVNAGYKQANGNYYFYADKVSVDKNDEILLVPGKDNMGAVKIVSVIARDFSTGKEVPEAVKKTDNGWKLVPHSGETNLTVEYKINLKNTEKIGILVKTIEKEIEALQQKGQHEAFLSEAHIALDSAKNALDKGDYNAAYSDAANVREKLKSIGISISDTGETEEKDSGMMVVIAGALLVLLLASIFFSKK